MLQSTSGTCPRATALASAAPYSILLILTITNLRVTLYLNVKAVHFTVVLSESYSEGEAESVTTGQYLNMKPRRWHGRWLGEWECAHASTAVWSVESAYCIRYRIHFPAQPRTHAQFHIVALAHSTAHSQQRLVPCPWQIGDCKCNHESVHDPNMPSQLSPSASNASQNSPTRPTQRQTYPTPHLAADAPIHHSDPHGEPSIRAALSPPCPHRRRTAAAPPAARSLSSSVAAAAPVSASPTSPRGHPSGPQAVAAASNS